MHAYTLIVHRDIFTYVIDIDIIIEHHRRLTTMLILDWTIYRSMNGLHLAFLRRKKVHPSIHVTYLYLRTPSRAHNGTIKYLGKIG